jgi:ribonuclease-3
MDLEPLQSALGYRFSSPQLLREALTHRSHGTQHNERLEFLGDGVLNCVIAAELFARFARIREGELSRLRAHLVCQESLHRIAQSIGLGAYLRLGEGELKSGGFSRPSILADAVEALVGAIFLDGGFDAVRSTLRALFSGPLAELDPKSFGKDPKTQLQELLQSRHIAVPRYAVVATRGAAHEQRFEVECLIAELEVRTLGAGASRRVAEQEAAQRAFEQIDHGK